MKKEICRSNDGLWKVKTEYIVKSKEKIRILFVLLAKNNV